MILFYRTIYSSLRKLIEKPPITGKEIQPLSSTSLNGFRLNPGPVDERFLLFCYIFILYIQVSKSF